MNQTEDDFLAGIIQLLFIGFIIGFLVLIVKLLSSFEVKHSKPHAPKPLEERLKLLPPSAKVLSDEAKLIFPDELNDPELYNFKWSRQSKIKFVIELPEDQLSEKDIIEIYSKRYEQNNWEIIENKHIYMFKSKTSNLESCIYQDYYEGHNNWNINFYYSGTSCY